MLRTGCEKQANRGEIQVRADRISHFAGLWLHFQRLPPGHFAGQWAAGEGHSDFDFVYGHRNWHPNGARGETASVERGGRPVQGDTT